MCAVLNASSFVHLCTSVFFVFFWLGGTFVGIGLVNFLTRVCLQWKSSIDKQHMNTVAAMRRGMQQIKCLAHRVRGRRDQSTGFQRILG